MSAAAGREPLPGALAEIEAVIGRGAALLIALAYRTQEALHVPRRPDDDHPLSRLIGADGARELAARFGGSALAIPRASRLLVNHLVAQGYSTGEIARALGLHRRTVRRYRRGAP